jgi:CopG family nickel-responsive transcriptional regulator
MRRLTISVDDDLAEQFDELVAARGYENRSEAFRDLVRRELGETRVQRMKASHCVANLSYVYNHHERQLADRLLEKHHGHHDLSYSTMHVHLDHENCLESVMLRGRIDRVSQFAESVIIEKGVRHGKLNLIPVEVERPARHLHVHRHFKAMS